MPEALVGIRSSTSNPFASAWPAESIAIRRLPKNHFRNIDDSGPMLKSVAGWGFGPVAEFDGSEGAVHGRNQRVESVITMQNSRVQLRLAILPWNGLSAFAAMR